MTRRSLSATLIVAATLLFELTWLLVLGDVALRLVR
jgi:hypothetical protein